MAIARNRYWTRAPQLAKTLFAVPAVIMRLLGGYLSYQGYLAKGATCRMMMMQPIPLMKPEITGNGTRLI